MSILASPALRWARRVTPELHFTGSATSNVNCTAIHNAAAKLWVSFWFKLDTAHVAGSGDKFLWGKLIDGNNLMYFSLLNGTGKGYFYMKTASAERFAILTTETSWAADTWHHAVTSISSAAGVRMVVNGGTAVTNADTNAAPNGANLAIGNRKVGNTSGIVGEIRDVSIGTDDLSTSEERQLLAGIIPADATQFYRLNEGYGTTAIDLKTGNDGAIDSANTWGTGLRQYVRY